MRVKYKIADMQKLAAKRGGKCLSKKYINVITKLKWQCTKGHIWEVPPTYIKSGYWCPFCAGNAKLTIKQMQKLATKRNGKCISDKYINSQTKLKWQCEKGHKWEARPADVKNGTWCPTCFGSFPFTIKQMKKMATNRGGKCLSNKYVNGITKLRWKCADGHVWEATPSNVGRGSWCPNCGFQHIIENLCREMFQIIFRQKFQKNRPDWLVNKRGNKMELDGYNEKLRLAFEYHGKQHFSYVNYFHNEDKNILKMRKRDDVTKKILCKRNGIKLIEIPFTIPLSKLYEYILKQCRKLDVVIPPHKSVNIANLKLRYFKKNLIELKKIAQKHKGDLLSSVYLGTNSNLSWKCTKGHEWEASPASIENGSWCPACAGVLPLSIDEMRILAIERGGMCLSRIYINAHNKLKWKCTKDHTWEATPRSIKNNNSWCLICSGSEKYTIEKINKLAKVRGGKCLSNKYINAHTKLKWQCKNGHVWNATPNSVRRGTWCPICGIEKSEGTRKSEMS